MIIAVLPTGDWAVIEGQEMVSFYELTVKQLSWYKDSGELPDNKHRLSLSATGIRDIVKRFYREV